MSEPAGQYNSMIVYYGPLDDKGNFKVIKRLESGAGETSCIECDGSGKWPYAPYAVPPDSDCIDCKGTGKVLVSI